MPDPKDGVVRSTPVLGQTPVAATDMGRQLQTEPRDNGEEAVRIAALSGLSRGLHLSVMMRTTEGSGVLPVMARYATAAKA